MPQTKTIEMAEWLRRLKTEAMLREALEAIERLDDRESLEVAKTIARATLFAAPGELEEIK